MTVPHRPTATAPTAGLGAVVGAAAVFALAFGVGLLAPILVEFLRDAPPRSIEGPVAGLLLAFGLTPVATVGYLGGVAVNWRRVQRLSSARRLGGSLVVGLGTAGLLWSALALDSGLPPRFLLGVGGPTLAFLGALLLRGRASVSEPEDL
jgi:hypothetical protein